MTNFLPVLYSVLHARGCDICPAIYFSCIFSFYAVFSEINSCVYHKLSYSSEADGCADDAMDRRSVVGLCESPAAAEMCF